MGQRSQTFLRIKNPMLNDEYKNNLDSVNNIKVGYKIFGEEEFTVVPFHHQWLYGLTFVGIAYNILAEARKNFTNHFHPFSPLFDYNTYPKGFLRGGDNTFYSNTNIQHTLDLIKHFISFQGNKEIAERTGRYGFERFSYIGAEHLDENGNETKFTSISEDCTLGDNNDGILIIDLVEQKYCFMNVFEFDYDIDDNGIYSLPKMTPIEAKEYVRAYYPSETEEIVFAKDLLKDFGVLSYDEVSAIFPKVKFNEPVKVS